MIWVDFRKQVWRLRTYLALGVMIAIPVITVVAFKLSGGPNERNGQLNLFDLGTRSGLNMPIDSLLVMSGFLLPVVVSLFAGSAIAEEASWGSLRYLLIRPVARGRLLAGKLSVVLLLALAATLLIAVTALAGGVAAFGWHPVAIPSFSSGISSTIPTSIVTISQSQAFARLVASTFYVAWCMTGIIAFAFMLSTITDAALGAVSGGIGLTVVSEILDAIPPLKTSRNFFITHYWQAWTGLFRQPMETGDIVRGVLIQLPYALAFLAFAWWWFHRKDILS
jgi:ABC-2 type transport system permease protein